MDEDQLRLNSLVAGLRGSVTSMQSAVTGQTTAIASLSRINRDLTLQAKNLADVFTRKTDELKKSFDTLNNSIKNMAGVPGTPGGGAGAGGGQPPTSPSPTPDESGDGPSPITDKLDKAVDIFVDQLVQAVDLFFNSVKAQTVEFLNISDKLLSVGFSIDQFRTSYAENNANLLASNTETNQRMLTLAGSVQDAARNTASLVDIGISPLSTDILNLAGRMGVLGQDVGKLMSVNQKLFTQGGLNSQELNSLAATLEKASIDQSVSTDKLIDSLEKLTQALPTINIAGLSDEASQLTVELAKNLPAGMKDLAGTIVANLSTAEGAIRAQALGIGDMFEMVNRLGVEGAAELLGTQLKDAGKQVSEYGQSVRNSVIGAESLKNVVGEVGVLAQQFTQGSERAGEGGTLKILESFFESFNNLKEEIMKPIQEAGAELANIIMQYVPAISDFIQQNGGAIKNFLVELVKGSFSFFKGFLTWAPNLIRVMGTIFGALTGYFMARRIIGVARDSVFATMVGALVAIAANTAALSLGAGSAAGLGAGAAAATTLTGAQTAGLVVGTVVGAGVGLAMADELATPLEGMVDSITSIESQMKRREARDENKETVDRLDNLNYFQREQASEFDTFLKNFMARNIDEMAMSRNAQNTVMGILVDRVEELTEVTRGTGREMGEVVEAGRAADALRTEVEPQ